MTPALRLLILAALTGGVLALGVLALGVLAPASEAEEAAAAVAAPPAPGAGVMAAAPLPAITVVAAAPAVLRERVVASGLVEAVEEVLVQPLVEGQPIEALFAEVGDRVEAGEVLARLSHSTLELQLSQLAANRAAVEAQIAQAEAGYTEAAASAAEARRVAERAQALAEAGSLPASQAEQAAAAATAAEARMRVAEQGIAAARAQLALVAAQITDAELRLARTEVRAPVGGLVVARNAQLGAIAVASGAPMFVIVRDGAMELHAELAEQDLLRVAPGQPARLMSAAGGGALSGRVRLVEPAIDRMSRLGRARIAIDDPSRVVTGMFLGVEILVAETEALAVPVAAVAASPQGPTVMRVAADGTVDERPVTTGIRDGDLIAITSGLRRGDLVVARAAAFVRDGDRINPVREGQDQGLAQAQGGTE
jgi:HlyD family secretion protein